MRKMRKQMVLKLAFGIALAAVAAVAFAGAFTPTAEGFNCWRNLGECPFSHIESAGTSGGCCVYRCPDGTFRPGICFPGLG